MIFRDLWHHRDDQASAPLSRGEQTRQEILARALKIAAQEGLTALTIGRLAKELRMSKSGLFAHFYSKRALELATLEKAREVFADTVVRPAQDSREGIERLWSLCDLWLQHIERRVFSGAYFFTGAFFEYAGRPGPIAEAITRIEKEWLSTLRRAVLDAQEQEEINWDIDAKQVARELSGTLVGAHCVYLLEGSDCCRKARAALLARLRELATSKIPASAFQSVGTWMEYIPKEALVMVPKRLLRS